MIPRDITQGTIVADANGGRFEFRRFGCATGLASCEKRVPVTVARIRRDGTVAPASMTECFDVTQLWTADTDLDEETP